MIENAVAVSLFGMLLGPMYPIVMNHAGKILPRKQLTQSVGQFQSLSPGAMWYCGDADIVS